MNSTAIQGQKILILGASSAIARATARLFAEAGASVFLVARDPEKLAVIAKDLEVRGAKQVFLRAQDLNRVEEHEALVDESIRKMGKIDIVLLAHGVLGDQKLAERDFAEAQRIFETNLLGPISLLSRLAQRLEAQKSGCLAVISSVAGDRGRQSNYFYGTSKGALSLFLQGLRNRLASSGVHVLTIKPGFVDTPMTADFPKGPLFVKPETIAAGIVSAIARNRNSVYLPWFWQIIMLIIKSIPEGIFKKLKL
jgi:decaprenylphospho-beta-D-erythro-pentofuranosid-2-ulose 2-reductase